MTLPKWAENACEEIDAGFFSANTFHNQEAIEDIEYYIGRWQRELVRIKHMLEEDSE